MRRSFPAVPVLAVAALFACAPAEEGPSEDELAAAAMEAQADSIAEALAMLTPESFDTISWESNQEALERGTVVFQFSCVKCHGDRGAGDGGFVQQGDTLKPPTFLTADWQFADDQEGLREHIWKGTVGGMPHWGLHGLKFRDVDAVARYISRGLRRNVS